jgi:flagella basal body P-ring formation protein FlgA
MRHLASVTIALFVCLALPAGEDAAAKLLLTLRADAVSRGDQITLSEAAEIACASAELAARAQSVVVGRAAPAGQTRTVTAADVLAALRRAGLTGPAETRGTQETKVAALAQMVDGKQMADAVTAAIRAEIEQDRDLEVETEITSVPNNVALRPGDVKLDSELPAALHPGAQSLRVRILQDSRVTGEACVGVRIQITGSVQVAAERLAAGDILCEADIKSVRRELTSVELRERCDAAKLVNLRAKSAITPGQVLSRSLFAAPHVIKRGDAVTLRLQRGTLELAARTEARTDAAADESVRLRLDNGAEVIARAVGPREASMDESHRR